jgi:SAM-dependent methyltransferase
MPAFSNFLEVQTRTPWGRTLAGFADFCAPSPGYATLDVGCGPGLLPAILAGRGCTALGVDLDLDLLRAKLGPGLFQADASRLPFRAESFDLVSSTNVLFLLDNPAAVLREWRRSLKSTGTICLLNPSHLLSVGSATLVADSRRLEGPARESLIGWARNAEAHARWTETETRDMLSAAGLHLKESVLRVGPGFARLSRAILSE